MGFNFRKHKHFPKVSSSWILLSFLFPFFIVKCENTVVDSPTGIELMTGKDDIGEDFSEEMSYNLAPQPFAILAFACALAGAAFAFIKIKNGMMISFVIAVLGMLSLLLLFWYIKSSDLKSQDGSNYHGFMSISLGFGYYICLLGYLINAMFYGFGYKDERKREGNEDERVVDRFI